jgi:gamma-glutamyl:cysteine ligase YbdK (ATP-grasp superfamily)
LPLIDPNAKEHSIATIELWHRAAQKAIGMLAHDPAALRAWADENLGTFGAVEERYPDTVKDIRAAIAIAGVLEAVTEQEEAE